MCVIVEPNNESFLFFNIFLYLTACELKKNIILRFVKLKETSINPVKCMGLYAKGNLFYKLFYYKYTNCISLLLDQTRNFLLYVSYIY
jgi:hypothetical protein